MSNPVSKFENGILYFTPVGNRSKEEMIQDIRESFELIPDGIVKVFILSDVTRANFNFTIEELKEISDTSLKCSQKYSLVTDVIIGGGHEEITNIMYYEEMSLSDVYRVKICSTVKEGYDWIQKQLNQN
jgi:precorrin-3B methylase